MRCLLPAFTRPIHSDAFPYLRLVRVGANAGVDARTGQLCQNQITSRPTGPGGDLEIGHPYAFETPVSAMAGAGYLTITNNGDAPDRLVEVRADFPRVEVHETVVTDGVGRMLPVEGIEILPGETVKLQPGGYHVMFMGLAQCSTSSVAGATIGGPFTLVDETGTTVSDTDVLIKPSLVYFGYTFCPDVCPMDSARNAEAMDLLFDRGYDVSGVFISIDPERDTVERVGEFTNYFHDAMIGLTGSDEQVAAASLAYKTFYARQPGDDDYYLVDHSTFTYLILPEYGFVEFFRRKETAKVVADTMACFIYAA